MDTRTTTEFAFTALLLCGASAVVVVSLVLAIARIYRHRQRNENVHVPTLPPLPWYTVWLRAITRPSVATFEDLLARVADKAANKGSNWVYLSATLAYLPSILRTRWQLLQTSTTTDPSDGLSWVLLCAIPLIGIVFVIIVGVQAAFANLTARAMSGKGTYDKLAYLFCAYTAPLLLVFSGINFCLSSLTSLVSLPLLATLASYGVIGITVLLGVYYLLLNVIAVKATHQLGWGESILSAFVGALGLFVLVVFFRLSPR